MDTHTNLARPLADFFEDYGYDDAVAAVAQGTSRTVRIDYDDLYQYDPELAADWINDPETLAEAATQAIDWLDLPVDHDPITPELVNLPDDRIKYPSELSTDDGGRYIGIRGRLEQTTDKAEKPLEIAFECQRCSSITRIPQANEYQEPAECQGCDRNGPFRINQRQSEWVDMMDLLIKTPPEHAASNQPSDLEGRAEGDTVHIGGEYGLMGHIGEEIIAYGILEREQAGGDNSIVFKRRLDVETVEFPDDTDDVDPDEYREEFGRYADKPDAVELFKNSIAPPLYETDAWETALEWAAAYAFGSPRIELEDGTQYRGDIHGAIFSGYGMGKSMFATAMAEILPDSIKRSATSLSSDVNLLAAAQESDFGRSNWVIKPGLLVRANGGHLILDEVDKTNAELSSMNDALEGEQLVDVEKAGVSATYESRCGVLLLGNPEHGRFDPNTAISEQIDIAPSTLSRMDGIITMEDTTDEEKDANIAEQVGEAYAEANQAQFDDREDFEALDRPVSVDVLQAWVKHARETVDPVFSKDLIPTIRDWYAEEVRQLNNDANAQDNMPVPATPRVVMWVIRFSSAFARCELSDTVEEHHVDRAKSLAKRLIRQNWDGEKFDVVKGHGETASTQQEQMEVVIDAIQAEAKDAATVAEETGLEESRVADLLEQLAEKGQAYRPQTGHYRAT